MNGTVKKIGIILLAGAVMAGAANLVHPRRIPWVDDWSHQVEDLAAEKGIPVIPYAAALERFNSGSSAFVDARSAEAYGQGRIPGAVSIPFDALDDHLPEIVALLDSGSELIIYCRNRECDDALLLAAELKAMGSENVVLFIDGFESWTKHGSEVEL